METKNKGLAHPFTGVPSSGSQGEIDLIALKAFKKAAQKAEIIWRGLRRLIDIQLGSEINLNFCG